MDKLKQKLVFMFIVVLVGAGVSSCAQEDSGAQPMQADQKATDARVAQSAQAFPSMQMQGVDLAPVEVDADAAAQRLAKGVTFPTISNQDRDDFDTEAFSGYHAYLAENVPQCNQDTEAGGAWRSAAVQPALYLGRDRS